MSEPPAPSDTIDHPRLLAEIDEEARRRRASGELPADFERELDLVFARFAPVHALGDDFAQMLERAEQSTFIDALAPTESSLPLVPHVKRVVRKAIVWEVRHVAQQVSAFAAASVRAIRLLSERVDRLESAAGVGATGSALARPAPRLDVDRWAPVVIAAVAGLPPGRVLHTESDDGALVAKLVEAGVDAYGVDPVPRSAPAGVELREDEALAHLRALPDGVLSAVVLSGCVDRLPVAALVELAGLARRKVARAGVIVVVGADPRAWLAGAADPAAAAADLAPGRSLHAETWAELLGAPADASVEVVPGPRPAGLLPVPGAPPDMAANLDRIDRVLFPPASYAVIARSVT